MRRVVAALAFVTALAGTAHAGITIARGADTVDVATGDARFVLSTKTFDVIHAASLGGAARLSPGRVTVDALGSTRRSARRRRSPPARDWVELRGWADRAKDLWYIARYQFFDGKPYARLVLTLTDRHDDSPAVEPGDRHWQGRTLHKWRLKSARRTAGRQRHPAQQLQLLGAGRRVDRGRQRHRRVLSMGARRSAARSRAPPAHAHRQGAVNQVVWHPMLDGAAELTALQTRWSGGSSYHAAKAVTFEIVDGAGATTR